MAIPVKEKMSVQDPIRQLYVEAGNSAKRDRRSDVRFSFFRPVTIGLHDGERISAFSRDISALAIGLVHNRALPVGEVELSIASARGAVVVRARIMRSESCGEGWHISAAEFIGDPTTDD